MRWSPLTKSRAIALGGRTTRTLLDIFSGNLFRIHRLVASWAERAREDIGNGCCMSPEATWARFCFFWAIDKKMTSIVIDKLHLKWRKYYLQSGVVAMHLCILHSLPFGAQNEIAQVSIELGQIVAKNIKQINSNGKTLLNPRAAGADHGLQNEVVSQEAVHIFYTFEPTSFFWSSWLRVPVTSIERECQQWDNGRDVAPV